MPTYEYECDACGHAFEELQRMSDPVIRKCPKCRKLKVRRLISGGAGVIFKGSGFYETDYKRKRPSPDGTQKAKSDGGESSSSDASKSGSDAKKSDAPASPKPDAAKAKPAAGKGGGTSPGKGDGAA